MDKYLSRDENNPAREIVQVLLIKFNDVIFIKSNILKAVSIFIVTEWFTFPSTTYIYPSLKLGNVMTHCKGLCQHDYDISHQILLTAQLGSVTGQYYCLLVLVTDPVLSS